MTILLYALLIIFIFTEIPLIIMMVYLHTHRQENEEIHKLKNILQTVLSSKFFFIFAQIMLVVITLTKPLWGTNFIIGLYSIAAILLCFVNWYALIEIRKNILNK